jgi:uncharacterized coiled-coil protein SlyX
MLEKLRQGSQMVVVDRHPARRGLIFLAVLAFGGVALASGYAVGLYQAGVDRGKLAELEIRTAEDQVRIEGLNRDLVDLRLTRKVDQQASITLRETIKELRDESAEQNEEIRFYRSLMDPASLEKGLQIAEFQLEDTADDQVAFRLLLTHASKRRDWVRGEVRVEVLGRRENDHLVLPLTDLAKVETYPLPFKFRYFQDLSGNLAMPENFEPESVVVTVVPTGKKAETLQMEYHWPTKAG